MGLLDDKAQVLSDSLHIDRIYYIDALWIDFPVIRWFFNPNNTPDDIAYDVKTGMLSMYQLTENFFN